MKEFTQGSLSPVTAGEADVAPAAGEAEVVPEAGDWLAPAAGEAELVPEAGDWLAPAAGEAEVVPDAGEADLAPAAGEAEVVLEAGDEDAAGLLLAPDAGDAPVPAGEAPDDDEAAGLCMTTAVLGSRDRQGLPGHSQGPTRRHRLCPAQLVLCCCCVSFTRLRSVSVCSAEELLRTQITSSQDCGVCRYRTDNNNGQRCTFAAGDAPAAGEEPVAGEEVVGDVEVAPAAGDAPVAAGDAPLAGEAASQRTDDKGGTSFIGTAAETSVSQLLESTSIGTIYTWLQRI